MSYRSTNGNSNGNGSGYEPSTAFDYAALDGHLPLSSDEEFWAAQGELLGDILRWLTAPRSLSGMGARCALLALYLNPEIVNKCTLKEISTMRGAPGVAALSKAMLEFQRRHDLKPSFYQKSAWMRERYRKSALVAHGQRGRNEA